MHNPKYHHLRSPTMHYQTESNSSDNEVKLMTANQNLINSVEITKQFILDNNKSHANDENNFNIVFKRKKPNINHKVESRFETRDDLTQVQRINLEYVINNSNPKSNNNYVKKSNFFNPLSNHLTPRSNQKAKFHPNTADKSQKESIDTIEKFRIDFDSMLSNLPRSINKLESNSNNLFLSPKSAYTGFLRTPNKKEQDMQDSDLKQALILYGINFKDKKYTNISDNIITSPQKKIKENDAPHYLQPLNVTFQIFPESPMRKNANLVSKGIPKLTLSHNKEYENIKNHKTIIIFPELMNDFDDLEKYWIEVNLYEYWKSYNNIFENPENIKYAHELYNILLNKLDIINNAKSYKDFLNIQNDNSLLRVKTPPSIDLIKNRSKYLLEEGMYKELNKLFIQTFMMSDIYNEEIIKQIKAEFMNLFKLKYNQDIYIDSILLLDGKELDCIIELSPFVDVLIAGCKEKIIDKIDFPKKTIENFIKSNYGYTLRELIKEKWCERNHVDKISKNTKKTSPKRAFAISELICKTSPRKSKNLKSLLQTETPKNEKKFIIKEESLEQQKTLSTFENSLIHQSESSDDVKKNIGPFKLNLEFSSTPEQTRKARPKLTFNGIKPDSRHVSEGQTTSDTSRISNTFRLPSLNVTLEKLTVEDRNKVHIPADQFKYRPRTRKIDFSLYNKHNIQNQTYTKTNIWGICNTTENSILSPQNDKEFPSIKKTKAINYLKEENDGLTILKLQDIHEINNKHPDLSRKQIYNIYSMFISMDTFMRQAISNKDSRNCSIESTDHQIIDNDNILSKNKNNNPNRMSIQETIGDSSSNNEGEKVKMNNTTSKIKSNDQFMHNPLLSLNFSFEMKSPRQPTLQDRIPYEIIFDTLDIFKGKSKTFCMEIMRAIEIPTDKWQEITWEKFVDLAAILVYKAANPISQTKFILNLFNPDNLPKMDKDNAFKHIREMHRKTQSYEQNSNETEKKMEEYFKEKCKLVPDALYGKFNKFWRGLQTSGCINDKEELDLDKLRYIYEQGKGNMNFLYEFIFEDAKKD